MGLGTKIGAGLAATGAAAGGAVAPLANVENDYQAAPVNDVPAIYQNVDYKDPMEQYRNIGNVGQLTEDMAGAHADGMQLKSANDEIGEQSNAERGPGYAEHTEPSKSILEQVREQHPDYNINLPDDTNQRESDQGSSKQETTPNQDVTQPEGNVQKAGEENDYYNGIGY